MEDERELLKMVWAYKIGNNDSATFSFDEIDDNGAT